MEREGKEQGGGGKRTQSLSVGFRLTQTKENERRVSCCCLVLNPVRSHYFSLIILAIHAVLKARICNWVKTMGRWIL